MYNCLSRYLYTYVHKVLNESLYLKYLILNILHGILDQSCEGPPE